MMNTVNSRINKSDGGETETKPLLDGSSSRYVGESSSRPTFGGRIGGGITSTNNNSGEDTTNNNTTGGTPKTSTTTWGTTNSSTRKPTTSNSGNSSWRGRWCQWPNSSFLDRDAVHFGIRMSVCITTACLFILLRKPGDELHQAIWIVVTVQFVCWFPSLDAASVVEKSFQRLYGTFIGASSGLACGFLSLLILDYNNASNSFINKSKLNNIDGDDNNLDETAEDGGKGDDNDNGIGNVMAQSTFLIICIASYTFLICWAAVQYKVGGDSNTKIITKYNYACILSLLTFYICVLPFYSDNEPKWEKAIWRVINVIAGCFLGGILSITILPRSTTRIVHYKMQKQILLAGEAAQAILHMAADSFSNTAYVGTRTTATITPTTSTASSAGGSNTSVTVTRANNKLFSLQSIRENISVSRRRWRKNIRISSSQLGIDEENNNNSSNEINAEDDLLALSKYEAAIKDWRTIKTQLGNLRYDPFHLYTPDMLLATYQSEMNNTLARTLRIQNTVLLLDGIIRNDPKHDFSEVHINLFADIGTLIQQMLSSSSSTAMASSGGKAVADIAEESQQQHAAFEELTIKMSQIRQCIIELSSIVSSSSSTPSVGTLGVDILGSRLDLAGMMMLDVTGTNGEDNIQPQLSVAATTPTPDDPIRQRESSKYNDEDEPDFLNINRTISLETLQQHDDQQGRGVPKYVHGSRVCALLFLQLVEHLTLRCVRLYQSWKECQPICDACDKQYNT